MFRSGQSDAVPSRAVFLRDFVLTRLGIGVSGLACLVPYLAWRGQPTAFDIVLAFGVAASICAALAAARTGHLGLGFCLSAASTAALALCAFEAGGGRCWPALIWLLADPIESRLSGFRRATVAAATVSCLGLLLALAPARDVVPETAPALAALALLVISSLARVAAPVSRARRLEHAGNVSAVAYDVREDALLRAVGALVTWHNRHGDVLAANLGSEELAGLVPMGLRGGGLLGRVHVSDRPAYLKALSDAANGPDAVSVEFRLRLTPTMSPDLDERASRDAHLSARTAWVEMRAHRIGDGRGTSGPAVVTFIRDTSAYRRHAEELEQARLEAVTANELKGRFLATVSHELRTPLNAIIGFSELLSVDHPPLVSEERRKEYAVIIRNSGHHLLEIVNTLLDMSKIESGNFDFMPEPFDLGELVRSCCDLMQLKIGEARIELTGDVPKGLPEVHADRRACRQILINLLSNAVKFTPAGGTVSVVVRRDADRIMFAVTDTGIGIREADLPRLGDPFFQAGSTYNRPHEGTGLGLSVVRGLVGLHHGTMSIASSPGAGTAVTVTLPIECRPNGGQAKPAVVIAMPRVAVRPLDRMSA